MKWRLWFALAVLDLKLAPAAFWALRPAEWRALLDGLEARAPARADGPDKHALDDLLQRYPDDKND